MIMFLAILFRHIRWNNVLIKIQTDDEIQILHESQQVCAAYKNYYRRYARDDRETREIEH